ncbi:unnamed protein product [Larinioides sclopetarius]
MAVRPGLCDLPAEIITLIFSHLDYTDLRKRPYGRTWEEHFIHWYRDMGSYIHCYAHLKKTWDRILSYFKVNCPLIYQTIKDGVSEEELDRVEESIGLGKLPTDFRCSYRIHNGQRLTSPGLMGSMSIPGHYRSESLLDLDTILVGYREGEGLLGCIPLTLCLHSGLTQYLAVTDTDGYEPNTIFYPITGEPVNGKTCLDAFISGTSFQDWLTAHADHLVNDDFPILQDQPFREDPSRWLKEYERISTFNRWDDTMCLANAYFFLKGTARLWYENNEENLSSWEKFQEQFKIAFGSKELFVKQAERELKNRAQKTDESTQSYIQSVLELCHKVNPQMTDNDKVSHLMKGIAEDVYRHLLAKDVSCTSDFIKECQRIEEMNQRRISKNKFARLPNVVPVATVGEQEDLMTLIRQIVREEVKKITASIVQTNQFESPSLDEVIREEVQQALCPVIRTRSVAENRRTEPRPMTHATVVRQPRRPAEPLSVPRQTDVWRTDDNRPVCFHCGRPGHVVRYCRERRAIFSAYRSRKAAGSQLPSPNLSPGECSRQAPFLHDSAAEETTNHITVSVATCFLPEISKIHPPKFFHTYRITMTMSPDAPQSEACQLETRHWTITDDNGSEEQVDGPGVVGEYPVMYPGASFSWVSSTSFTTTYGNMRGYFRMRNLQTSE